MAALPEPQWNIGDILHVNISNDQVYPRYITDTSSNRDWYQNQMHARYYLTSTSTIASNYSMPNYVEIDGIEDDRQELRDGRLEAKNTAYLQRMGQLNAAGLLNHTDQLRYKQALDMMNYKRKVNKRLEPTTLLFKPKPEDLLFDEENQLPDTKTQDVTDLTNEDLGIAYAFINKAGNTAHNVLCITCNCIVEFELDVKKNLWYTQDEKHKGIYKPIDNNSFIANGKRRALCNNMTRSMYDTLNNTSAFWGNRL